MPTPPQELPSARDPFSDPQERRRETLRRIGELQSRSIRGLWYVCMFLAVSIAARWEFPFIPPLSEGARSVLGRPPPPGWISVALVLYSFSAIVLALSRMMSDSPFKGGLDHVGYLTAFYVFYYFADSLRENFWAVFAAGMTILGLVAYAIWTQDSELIREEREKLARLEPRSKPPAGS